MSTLSALIFNSQLNWQNFNMKHYMTILINKVLLPWVSKWYCWLYNAMRKRSIISSFLYFEFTSCWHFILFFHFSSSLLLLSLFTFKWSSKWRKKKVGREGIIWNARGQWTFLQKSHQYAKKLFEICRFFGWKVGVASKTRRWIMKYPRI